MAYTKKVALARINQAMVAPKKLYKDPCINWKGQTTNTKEFYTEIFATEILGNLKIFNSIKTKTRSGSYNVGTHRDLKQKISKTNRNEEIFAKRLVDLHLEGLGEIIDFQVPLKVSIKDKGAGKIDLLSFNKEASVLFLIELKYKGNKETLLRAILESYTYFKMVDKNKLKKDFKGKLKSPINSIDVLPAVLVVPGCFAYDQLIDLGKLPNLEALADALDVKLFSLETKQH